MKEYKLKINSNDYHVVVSGLSNGRADVMVNGQSYSVEIADAGAASDAGKSASAPAVTATAPAPAAKPAAGGAVKSPLPGVVLDIQVAVGDRVGTGQRLMILEAMKMENNIDSDREGNALSLMDVISVEDDMLENLDARDSCAKVRRCVENCLTEREAKVISLRYGLDGEGPRTQREIASSCGISRSYVSRLEKKALGKLREAMEKG